MSNSSATSFFHSMCLVVLYYARHQNHIIALTSVAGKTGATGRNTLFHSFTSEREISLSLCNNDFHSESSLIFPNEVIVLKAFSAILYNDIFIVVRHDIQRPFTICPVNINC